MRSDNNTNFIEAVLCCLQSCRCAGNPIKEAVLVLKAYSNLGHSIHMISYGEESSREETVAWLEANDVPFDVLRIDATKDPISFKVEYLKYLKLRGFEPILGIEHSLESASALHEETGLPTLVLHGCY